MSRLRRAIEILEAINEHFKCDQELSPYAQRKRMTIVYIITTVLMLVGLFVACYSFFGSMNLKSKK
jgi:hypothetical protein